MYRVYTAALQLRTGTDPGQKCFVFGFKRPLLNGDNSQRIHFTATKKVIVWASSSECATPTEPILLVRVYPLFPEVGAFSVGGDLSKRLKISSRNQCRAMAQGLYTLLVPKILVKFQRAQLTHIG